MGYNNHLHVKIEENKAGNEKMRFFETKAPVDLIIGSGM